MHYETLCWQFKIETSYLKQVTSYHHSENEIILLLARKTNIQITTFKQSIWWTTNY